MKKASPSRILCIGIQFKEAVFIISSLDYQAKPCKGNQTYKHMDKHIAAITGLGKVDGSAFSYRKLCFSCTSLYRSDHLCFFSFGRFLLTKRRIASGFFST